MKAKTAIQISAYELVSREQPEHVAVTCDETGKVQALAWRYNSSDAGLYPRVKRRGGRWDRAAGGWTFADPCAAQGLLEAIAKKHPDWPIIGHPNKPFSPSAGIRISHTPLPHGRAMCLAPIPLPYFTRLEAEKSNIYRVAGARKDEVALLVGPAGEINAVVDSLISQGAICDGALATKWQFAVGSQPQVKVAGWAVQIVCVVPALSGQSHPILSRLI